MSAHKSPIWHPFTQHGLKQETIQIDNAAGAYLFARDEEEGTERRIIDAISSWWVITHGHCHPKIVQAVQKQAARLDQVIFAGFTHEPAETLAPMLLERCGDDFSHVFYSDSGSTAVEVALKMAIGFWAQTSGPRKKVIAFEGGYHGDTFGTMSAGGRSIYNRIYEPFLFEVIHIPVPAAGAEAKSFDALEAAIKEHGDDIAAFIFEPLVLGAGGMIMYSADALKTLVDMCRARDILLIADEVMTGFGRTGSFLACDQAKFSPDILCLSKGLTGGFLAMGATLCRKDIYDAFYDTDRAKMFYHSSSFTGNPLAVTSAVASMQIWEDEDVEGRISSIAEQHADMACLFSKLPEFVNIRQKGTILAMDLAVDDTGYLSDIQPKLYDYFLSKNILLRPLGNTLYVLPPYCIQEDDLAAVYSAVKESVDL